MHSRDLGVWTIAPGSRAAFPGDHRVATTSTPGRKIDTTSATLIKVMICEGDTISRLGGHGRPGVASGEFDVLAIDAPPLNPRGGMVPAEVVAPDHPINEATALECVAPLQTIVRSARPHTVRDSGLPQRKVQDGSHFTRARDADRRNVRLAPRRRDGAAREPPRSRLPPPRRPPSPTSSRSRKPTSLRSSRSTCQPGAVAPSLPIKSGDPGIDLRPARSGHLAAVAVLDALQRRLARALGAIAQRFGRRAPTGLDQCRGRQHVPAVVLHVRPGVQPGPEGQRLPRCLHALHAA